MRSFIVSPMRPIALFLALALPLQAARAQSAPAPSVPDSLAPLRAALREATADGDSGGLAALHERIGLVHWREDRFDSALVQMLTSRELFTALGDSADVARLSNALGSSHYQLGNYELALQAYMRALDIRAADGNVLGQAYLHTNMAKAYQDWRQFDRALASADSGVALADSVGDGHALGYALNTRADILVQLGRIAEARDAAERSLAAYYSGAPRLEPRDSVSAWSINVMTLGEADLADGRAADALRRFTEIFDRARSGGSRRGQAHSLLAMARAEEALGRPADALGAYRRALTEADAIGHRSFRLEALAGMSRAAQRGGDAASALRFARAHEALRDSLFDARTAQRVAAIELEAEAARQRAATLALVRQQAAQAAELRQQRMLTMMVGAMLALTLGFVAALLRSKRALEKALDEVRTLSGFIPICANCKNVRDDAGYWQSVEEYLASRSVAQFSHSICNSCGPQLYGADWVPHAAPSAPARADGPTRPAAP